MKKLPSLMIAPNGARKTKFDHPEIPLSLSEIVETAISCHAAGADGLHLHLRDDNGRHILDADMYLDALETLHSEVPEMAVQVTTEAVGKYLPSEQQSIVEAVRPDFVSISISEMMSGSDSSKATRFFHCCFEQNIAVQHILYGPDDLGLMHSMIETQEIPTDELQLLFVLGRYSAGQQSMPKDLVPFLEWLNVAGVSADWAACAFGIGETECLKFALQNGGKIRVGFENSLHRADGTLASDNSDRVREMAEIKKLLKSH